MSKPFCHYCGGEVEDGEERCAVCNATTCAWCGEAIPEMWGLGPRYCGIDCSEAAARKKASDGQ